MIRTTAFLLLSLSLAPAAIAAEVEFKNPDSFKQLNLPFSEAVRVDDLLFLSGQLGNKPGGLGLVEGGIGPETKQTMENIKNVLIRNKLGLDRVVKCTMFLDDIDDWPAANEVYKSYFTTNPPARSSIATGGLALGAKIEIECIAAY